MLSVTQPLTTEEFLLSQGLLTIEETAAWLRLPVATLRHYRAIGEGGPKSAKIGRRVMYRKSDVEAYINAAFAVSA
jgi:excisionase family DNA binding protein